MCNCYLCQKQTGSPFSLQARFPNEQVKIEGKSTVWKFPIDGAKPTRYQMNLAALPMPLGHHK
jgi:hypothetical protein